MGVAATRAAEEAAARPRGVTSRPITDDLEHPRGRGGRPTCRASPPPFFIFFSFHVFSVPQRERVPFAAAPLAIQRLGLRGARWPTVQVAFYWL